MNLFAILNTPFPRPERSKRNLLWLLLVGFSCCLFIILFKPFGIQNVYDQWFYNLVIFSMGLIFVGSILLFEWGIPNLFPKPFQNWTFGKAILWYTLMVLFVGGLIFLYKSFWAGFRDFTLLEYYFVIGRVTVITFTVSFFVLGIYQFINRKKISLITKKEDYLIKAQNGKSMRLNLKDILYISSNDNYVDIHYRSNGARKKELFRSSLKNVESQIVNPLSPIYRCHRGYLINIEYFKIQKAKSRSMTISLDDYEDEIPVSQKYVENIKELLPIRH